jgi:hypothetical protein
MKAIVTTKSVVLSTPVTDAKGKPVTEKVKWANREREHQVHDHMQHGAGTVLAVGEETDAVNKVVSKELADELVADGHAREHVSGLDDEVSPVKDDVLS